MDSAMIGKIQKARRYAEEPDRVVFSEFRVILNGDHKRHAIEYHQGHWTCDCDFFAQRGVCSHTMTMERILGGMLPPEWREEMSVHAIAR